MSAATSGRDAATPRARRRPTGSARVSQSERLQQQIKNLIVKRGLKVGDPLPTELELIDEFGCGRSSLREALKALQALGIIEIRHGYGMYVSRMSLDALVQGLTFHGRISLTNQVNHLANLVEIRQVLELGLVQLLIEKRDVDLTEAERFADAMKIATAAGHVPPELDQNFHEALYRPLRNPLAIELLRAFWNAYLQVKDVLGQAEVGYEQTAEQHREILRAIRAGERDAANTAVIRHFDDLRVRIIHLWSSNLPTATDHPE